MDTAGLLGFNLVTLEKKFGDLHFRIFELPRIPDDRPYMLLDPSFYVDSLPTAFIVVLECLISAKIADSVTNTKFHVKRELKGLYITHLIIGAAGGFPSTASLPRTALNIKSGATHKYSGLISSIFLLLLGLIFFPFFKYLPICVIASQMCYIAIRLVNFDEVFHMFKKDKPNFNLLILCFIVGILTDPIIGIFLGLLIYQLLFSELLLNPYSEVILTEDRIVQGEHKKTNNISHFCDIPDKEGKYVIYRFVGVVSFMNIDIHKERILSLARNDDSIIVLSLRYMNITDVNAIEALKQMIDEIENNDVKRKIPKNYQNEFLDDNGKLIVPDIESGEDHTIKENNYLGRKIIIAGISKAKYSKFAHLEWFKELKEKNQLYLTEDINNFERELERDRI
jgi:MFS superfamily sulfate permease-like transporter